MELGKFFLKCSMDILSFDSYFKWMINEILMLGCVVNLLINYIYW